MDMPVSINIVLLINNTVLHACYTYIKSNAYNTKRNL